MDDFFDRFQSITGISKYSNAEVITPLNIVKDMVDLLPADIFKPEAKFLDPAVKSGRFLAEIYRRLFDSPLLSHMDEQSRRRHILENQLYGLATSPTAATIVRKQLYNDPTIAGNVVYTDHYLALMADKKTDFRKLIEKEFGQMKFDVVIGNPPYQEETGGFMQRPIYNKFVDAAIKSGANYVSMIIPAKWMGNSNLNRFRDQLLYTGHMKKICWIEKGSRVFKDVSTGSLCYFLWTKQNQPNIEVINILSDEKTTATRNYMDTYNQPFVPNKAAKIISKLPKKQNMVSYVHKGIFDIRTNELAIDDEKVSYKVLTSSGFGHIDKERVNKCSDVGTYNVYIGQATSEHAGEPDKQGKYKVVTTIGVLGMNEVCTDSYIPIGTFENESEAVNCSKYIRTKFTRHLMTLCLSGNLMKSGTFEFVPMQDFTSNSDIDWSQSVANIDKQLYAKYGLTKEEQEYIENTIKPME